MPDGRCPQCDDEKNVIASWTYDRMEGDQICGEEEGLSYGYDDPSMSCENGQDVPQELGEVAEICEVGDVETSMDQRCP